MKKRYFVGKAALDRVTPTGKLTSPFLNSLLTQLRLTQRLWLLLGLLSSFLSATAQFCPNGTVVAGGNGKGSAPNQLSSPYSVVVDGAGNLYVSDKDNNRVQKFTPGSTQGVTVAGGNGRGSGLNQFNQAQGLLLDEAGYLYVAEYNNSRVLKFPPNSTSATSGTVVAGGNGDGSGLNQLASPTTIAMDASGNLYVDDLGNHRIIKFPPNSTSTTSGTVVAGGNGSGNGLNQIPISDGLFVDASGAIYVSNSSTAARVLKFPPNSSSATDGTIVAGGNGRGSGLNQLFIPYGILVDESGNLYVSDTGNGWVIKFPPNSTSATPGTVVAGGLNSPIGVFIDLAGNLYVNEADRVTRFTLESPYGITQQPASSSSVCPGTTVTNSVSTSGTVSSYQWYKDGNLLASQSSATLTLPNAQTTNSGSYIVVVTGSCTSVTSTAFSLTVTTQSPDYQPLVDLYNSTNGANWTNKTGWLNGCSPCG